ncbi:rhomboid family intramembrane serine protease [Meiothermus sp.]|uniref:rhomboid family intramembrane serine protease n=1 Tax=Meiothermus sp. TaxID=1955249 RepID=UPI0021DBF848|nr:rhomboid family intramembrane serine protease [Meiothermus sp.]GIW24263.1 MAG: rhomboid family intramembrane serine protease [Meiothermus sp.]
MIPIRDSLLFHGPAPVTKAIILLCGLAFYFQFLEGFEDSFARYGFIPTLFFEDPLGQGYRLLSSMFVHGSLGHLLGNLWFLWVFGPSLEARLGSGRYVGLYLLSGIAAALVQAFLTPDPAVPMVGASGAISGVTGGYVLLFPRAYVLTWLFPFFWAWLPAVLYLGYWAALQLFNALLGMPGVAWWAHLGGFATGMLLAWRMQPRRNYRAAPFWEHWYYP